MPKEKIQTPQNGDDQTGRIVRLLREHASLLTEAADEIERLQARVLELEESLIEECGTLEELKAFRDAYGLTED